MATTTKKVAIEFDAKTQAVLAAFKGVERGVKALANENKRAHDQMLTGWRRLKDGIQLVQGAIQLVSQAYRATVGAVGEWMRMADAQHSAIQDLATALGQHGMAWDDVSERVLTFSATLQRELGRADDETQRVMASMAAATGGAEVALEDLERATVLVYDVAQSTGSGIQQVQDAMSRLISGGSGSMRAFRSIAPGLVDDLQAIMDAGGSTADAMSLLEDQFGGAAAAVDSLTINSARVSHALGDVREALGGMMNAARRAALESLNVAGGIDGIAAAVEDAESPIGSFIRNAIAGFVSFGAIVTQIIARVMQGISGLVSGVRVTIHELLGYINQIQGTLVEWWGELEEDRVQQVIRSNENRIVEIDRELRESPSRIQSHRLSRERAALVESSAERSSEAGAIYRNATAIREAYEASAAEHHQASQDLIDGVLESAQSYETFIQQIGTIRDAINEAVRGWSGEGGTVTGGARGGRGGGMVDGDPLSASSMERTAEGVNLLGLAWAGVIEVMISKARSAMGDLVDAMQKTPFSELGDTKQGALGLGENLVSSVQSQLGSLTEIFSDWSGGIVGIFQNLGQSIMRTLGDALSQTGTSLLSAIVEGSAGFATAGPLGLLMVLGSVLVRAASGLLGGTSASSAALSRSRMAADVIPALMGDVTGAGGQNTYLSVHAGAQFGPDQAASMVRTGMSRLLAVGELPVMP